MIKYRYDEEKPVALHFADLLNADFQIRVFLLKQRENLWQENNYSNKIIYSKLIIPF